MKKYYYISKFAIENELAYNSWYWSGIVGFILKILVTYFFWNSIYLNRNYVGGLTLNSMLTYVIISMILNQLNIFGTGRTLSLMIARGEVAIELIRPYNLILKIISYNNGQKVVEIVKNILAIFLIGIIFIGISTPNNIHTWIIFCISSILGIVLMQLIDLCIGMLAFWTTNTWGLLILRNSMLSVFSGALLPLDLFPQLFQNICNWLPFKYVIYVPISIFIGYQQIDISIINLFLIQILWIFIMIFILYLAWRKAMRVVTIFGG